jgi:hypothetical protein
MKRFLPYLAALAFLFIWVGTSFDPKPLFAQTIRPIVIQAPYQHVVGMAPTQLPSSGTVLGVTLKAMSPNGNFIYLGSSNAVNTNSGWPLADGDTITIEVSNANQLWAVSTASNQRIAILPYRRQ